MPTQQNNVTLRVPKGSDLTIDELDNNFNELVSLANGPCIIGDKGPIGPTGLQGAIYSVDTPINPDLAPTNKTWIVYDPDLNTITEIYNWVNGTWILKSFSMLIKTIPNLNNPYEFFLYNNKTYILNYGFLHEVDYINSTILNSYDLGQWVMHPYILQDNRILFCPPNSNFALIFDINDPTNIEVHNFFGYELRGGVIVNNNFWFIDYLNSKVIVFDLTGTELFSYPIETYNGRLFTVGNSVYVTGSGLYKFDGLTLSFLWHTDNQTDIQVQTSNGLLGTQLGGLVQTFCYHAATNTCYITSDGNGLISKIDNNTGAILESIFDETHITHKLILIGDDLYFNNITPRKININNFNMDNVVNSNINTNDEYSVGIIYHNNKLISGVNGYNAGTIFNIMNLF